MKKKATLADQQLVSTFQQTQSADSFEMLYHRYMRKVFQTCLSMTRDSVAAEDYTQDIFLRVFSKLNTFQNRSSFSTWLYSISYNYCLDRIRLESRLPLESLSDVLPDHALSTEEDPEDATEHRLQLQEEILNDLSGEELTLLQLKYEQSLTIQGISQRLNLSESAVKMRLKRSRDKLRDKAEQLTPR